MQCKSLALQGLSLAALLVCHLLIVLHYRIFNAANLGGELGDSLGSFASIRSMYVSLYLDTFQYACNLLLDSLVIVLKVCRNFIHCSINNQ